MIETMHRLHIADPRVFWALPAEWQARHLAHVRNDLGGVYAGSGAAPSSSPAPPPRRGGATDMMAVFQAIERHRTEPPSPGAVKYARQVLSLSGVPDQLMADAQATLRAAGEL